MTGGARGLQNWRAGERSSRGGRNPGVGGLGTGHSDGGEVEVPGGAGLLVGGRFRLGVCWDCFAILPRHVGGRVIGPTDRREIELWSGTSDEIPRLLQKLQHRSNSGIQRTMAMTKLNLLSMEMAHRETYRFPDLPESHKPD